MATISVTDLCKSFDQTEVLKGVGLDIADGEFAVLVGPSGCGKSTLLRILAGLEQASSGSVQIDGREVLDTPARARNVAMVFQSYALYPHMSVAGNIGFNLRIAGLPRAEIRRRVEQVAEILHLTPFLDRRPAHLSGGQRQRVAMGRAMIREPKVFLYDEPLSNLDAKLRVEMRSEIKALHQRLGITSVYVTHDQIEAMTLADRVVVMNGGRIEQQGAPMDLYWRPANLFVAGFIGAPSMNFFSGQLVRNGGGMLARIDGGPDLPLTCDRAEGARRVILGVRPEHLVPDPEGAFHGRVEMVEPLGAQALLTVQIAGASRQVLAPSDLQAARGDLFSASVAPGNLHVFDRLSGLRLDGPGQGLSTGPLH